MFAELAFKKLLTNDKDVELYVAVSPSEDLK